jgi:hypothetical protein
VPEQPVRGPILCDLFCGERQPAITSVRGKTSGCTLSVDLIQSVGTERQRWQQCESKKR